VLLVSLVALGSTFGATLTPALEFRAALGAQVDGDPHGVIDLAVRRGPWSATVYTDTLDLRWSDEADDHRLTVGARGELFVAGLMTSPWSAGGKDPARALTAHYGGLDAEYVHYLPHGLYAGLAASARLYAFGTTASTVGPAPPVQLVAGPTLRLGWWQAEASWVLEGGFDVLASTEVVFAPRAATTLRLEPRWSLGPLTLGPLVEARAGVAHQQDRTTLTRVGGLNPYVVPLAGAAWAEWWADDYAAVRAGLRAAVPYVSLAVVIDAVALHTPVVPDPTVEAWGLGALLRVDVAPFFAELSGGWAPQLLRQADVPRVSGWVRLGLDWTRF
jgi:hypothetical protein